MEEMDLEILPAAEDLAEVHLDANIFDGPPVSESMSVRQLLKKVDENVTILDLGTRLFNSKQTKSITTPGTWRRHVEKISKFESDRRKFVWLYSASDWQIFLDSEVAAPVCPNMAGCRITPVLVFWT
jgi:hypothetical protein